MFTIYPMGLRLGVQILIPTLAATTHQLSLSVCDWVEKGTVKAGTARTPWLHAHRTDLFSCSDVIITIGEATSFLLS